MSERPSATEAALRFVQRAGHHNGCAANHKIAGCSCGYEAALAALRSRPAPNVEAIIDTEPPDDADVAFFQRLHGIASLTQDALVEALARIARAHAPAEHLQAIAREALDTFAAARPDAEGR